MAVIYESKRFPLGFNKLDAGGLDLMTRVNADDQLPYPVLAGPRNGALATGRAVNSIIENEHWLAMRDTPMINFFDTAANGDNHPSGSVSAWTNSSKTIRLILPPYCRWATFHFLCARTFSDASINMNYIQVASGVHTVLNTSIPWGEDLALTGKAALSYYSADWVHFAGVDLEESGGPTACRIVLDATDHATWTEQTVTITVSGGVNVYAAAYRVLPAFGTLQVHV